MPSGQRTSWQGSLMQLPPQHAWSRPQVVPRHMLLTHMPTPLVTAHTCDALHFTLAQGSGWHMPSTQRSPLMHDVGHSGTQLPFEQYWLVSHCTEKQGSDSHIPGLPMQISPSSQGKVRQESS